MVSQSSNHAGPRRSSFGVTPYNSSTSKRQSREFQQNSATDNQILALQTNELNYLNEIPSTKSPLVVSKSSSNTNVLEYIKPNNFKRPRAASHQFPLPPLKRGSCGNVGAKNFGGQISRKILFNIIRAFLVRALFIVHSLTTIWATVNVRNDSSIWAFALVSSLVAVEGAYTIVLRGGDERKWFSPSILLYILATAPPLHLLETQICEWHTKQLENNIYFHLLEQLLLVILIVGRWFFPKGEISREQLSQILLAYLAISSDIVEFFDVFKEKVVYQNIFVQNMVLYAWTLSLLQFPFVLTVSRARKMRVAIINEETAILKKKINIWQSFYDVDLMSIILANGLQDIPFFIVRLYLITFHGLLTYTMIFFICKNALIIVLQTYRAFILINDRYVHPRNKGQKEQRLQQLHKRRSTGPSILTIEHDSDLKQRKKIKQQQRKLIKEKHKSNVEKLKKLNLYPIQDSRSRRNTQTAQTTDIELIVENQKKS